jgi:hypothetical protein
MVNEQVGAEDHARALTLGKEFSDWQGDELSREDFLDMVTARRQRTLELEKFVNSQKV